MTEETPKQQLMRSMMEDFVANEKLEEQNKLNRKECHREQIMACIADEQDSQQRRYLASWIYLANKNISAMELAVFMGAPPGATKTTKYIKPTLFRGKCRNCMEDSPIPISSRSDITYDKYGMFSRVTNAHHISYHTCDACQKKSAEAFREATEREQRESARELDELRTMPYRDYLETDHWEYTRKRALSRANYKCQLCNANGVLHVHHKTYKNRGDERNEDLIVLCANCHAKFHDKLEAEGVTS